ncbi:MAG: DNA-binding protein [Oscillatoria sp. SIO1A7]|nr:DNA-binding protein [Oscillatoria sp. SIO1A7]
MKFDWSEYFKLAQELAAISGESPASQEAKLRSAISRAYYSVFCIARNYLRDVEKNPRLSRNKTFDFNEHRYVADEFTRHPSKSKKMQDIGRDLARLRRIRNTADYDDMIVRLQNRVNQAFSLAQLIMTSLRDISQ